MIFIMKKKGISKKQANEEWEAFEKAQHARHEYITGTKRGDRHNRDILIDSSLLGWEKTSRYIIEMIEYKFQQNETKKRHLRYNKRAYLFQRCI